MHFFTAAVALFASLALAQQNAINIPSGQSTLDITAGQPQTITWTNPSSGDVTIKLQQSGSSITPDSGITLATVPASDGTATFTIDPSQVNSFQYTIEIIDNSNPTNINFSPNFGIPNAEGTAVESASTASATGSVTGSSTATDSTATDSTATDSTMSITSSASMTESTSSETTGSTITDSSSNSASSTTSSAAATETTSAPSSEDNAAAGGLKVQGGLVALIAVAVAVL